MGDTVDGAETTLAERMDALDEWIEEHRREIAECPATPPGYRRADSLRYGLNHLIEYRASLRARSPNQEPTS